MITGFEKIVEDRIKQAQKKGDDQHHLGFDPIHPVLITIGVLDG